MKRIQYHVTLVLAGAVLFLTAACVSSSGPQISCPSYTLEFGARPTPANELVRTLSGWAVHLRTRS